MIDLYYRPGAASLVVHAALEEVGAEYNLIRATREDGRFGPPEAARLNPDGRVPTVSFDGLAMTESAACLMHISDLYQAAELAPVAGTPERGLWYRWLVYLVNPVQSTFYGFIAPSRSAPPSAEEAIRTHAADALGGYRAKLDKHLAERGRYLLGERFTSADLFLFMLTRWGRRLENRWWDRYAAEHFLSRENCGNRSPQRPSDAPMPKNRTPCSVIRAADRAQAPICQRDPELRLVGEHDDVACSCGTEERQQ